MRNMCSRSRIDCVSRINGDNNCESKDWAAGTESDEERDAI